MSDVGTAVLGLCWCLHFPMAQQHLLQLAPSCRGPAVLDSAVTPVPALTEVAPTVTRLHREEKAVIIQIQSLKGKCVFRTVRVINEG